MTATWTTAARRLLLPALVLASAASAPASAQDAGQQPQTGCSAERCLSVGWTSAVGAALDADDGLSIDELSDGLTVAYQGDGPLAVRLIAARYDLGRLVRYGVSERVELDGPGAALTVEGARAVLQKAFAPVTNRDLTVAGIDHDLLAPNMETAAASFVGEVPPTYLATAEERALFPLEDVAAEDVQDRFDGSVGVILVLPDDDSLRGPEALATRSALVRLHYAPKDRASPTG